MNTTEPILTAKAVQVIFMDCLFKDGEPTEPRIEVEGIMSRFGFHPQRLEAHRAEIEALLAELPEPFRVSAGGGWSFLQACVDKNGEQWGEHSNIEQLFALGQGIKKVTCLLPREMWQAMPGGMPYYSIDL